MAVKGQEGLNKDLRWIASKGLADLTREGLAPSTTDSVLYPQSESDSDSVGEDTNSPSYAGLPETGLPAAEHHEDPPERNKTTR